MSYLNNSLCGHPLLIFSVLWVEYMVILEGASQFPGIRSPEMLFTSDWSAGSSLSVSVHLSCQAMPAAVPPSLPERMQVWTGVLDISSWFPTICSLQVSRAFQYRKQILGLLDQVLLGLWFLPKPRLINYLRLLKSDASGCCISYIPYHSPRSSPLCTSALCLGPGSWVLFLEGTIISFHFSGSWDLIKSQLTCHVYKVLLIHTN